MGDAIHYEVSKQEAFSILLAVRASTDWGIIKSKHDIHVLQRFDEELNLVITKATMKIKTTFEKAVEVGRTHAWFRVDSSVQFQLLEQHDPTHADWNFLWHFPFPFNNRDAVVTMWESKNPKNPKESVTWGYSVTRSDSPKKHKVVRFEMKVNGTFVYYDTNPEFVVLELYFQSDLKLKIPQWALRLLTVAFWKSMKKVKFNLETKGEIL